MPSSGSVDVNRLLAILNDATAKIEAIEQAKTEPLAVVGIACNFPSSNTPEDFWSLLVNGKDAVTEVPADRWDTEAFFDTDPSIKGKMYSKAGGFIDTIELFDNDFFSVSPREALNMDPQQRRLLELSWEALERAAINPQTLRGSKTSVYVGVTTNDYGEQIIRSHGLKDLDSFFLSGNTTNAIAGRISYFFGFQGASLTVDTACSSSLTGIHLACQSLRSGESDVALAAGTNLILAPDASVATCSTQMLSPSGRCRTFSKDADGYVRSEGAGVVVLKRLSDAEKDGNPILALVRGSAINQDGASAGLTVPNGPAQESLIRQALENAGMQSSDISYLEAHGTGTPLGDPIEVRSAAAVYCKDRAADKPLLLGSVKTNIGHLEACAGMAGFIKSVLSIHNKVIPPHLHFDKPNDAIPWRDYSLAVPQQLSAWPDGNPERAAAVSSFGASGSNAHVILAARLESDVSQKATETLTEASDKTNEVWRCLPISAKTQEALIELISRYIEFLAKSEEATFAVCASAAMGRKHFDHRAAVVGRSNTELAKALQELPHDAPTQSLTDPDTDAMAIANRYLSGESIDWSSLEGYAEQQKAVLPVYPFKKSKFWLPLRDPSESKTSPEGRASDNQSDIALYEPYWKIQSRPLNSQSALTIDLKKLVADVSPKVNDWQRRDAMADYLSGVADLEQASVSVINSAFLQLGISLSAGSQSFENLCQQAKVIHSKRTYFKRLLAILCEAGALIEETSAENAGMQVWRSTELWADSPTTVASIANNKIVACEWRLLSKCGEQLANVLSGTCDPVELLFPNGEFTAVAPLYKEAYGAQAINQIVAESVLAIRRQLPKDQTLRILEIGAGTGGTTTQILPCLEKAGMWGNVEYTFTDISPYFLDKAKDQFSDYEGMSYRILDLEKNCLEQGFDSSSYDLVLGINVVHATRDVQQVLQNVEQLLVPGGLCLLQEAFTKIRFIDVIFGMTDGWWAFTDHELRSEHALLDARQWQHVFEKAGFTSASVTTPLGSDAGLFAMQGIIVGEKSSTLPIQRSRSWWLVEAQDSLREKFTALIKQRGDLVHSSGAEDLLPPEAKPNEKINVIWCGAVGQGMEYPAWIESLLALIKTIVQKQLPVTLWLLSNNANLVNKITTTDSVALEDVQSEPKCSTTNRFINPGQATLWGIGRTVALEYPEIWGGLIDIDSSAKLVHERLLSKMLDDIRSNSKEDFIAYRDLDRYVQRLSKVPGIVDKQIRFPSEASYLVTGGSGGIAIELVKWLLSHGGKFVILVGRSELTDIVASQVRELNDSGGCVSYHQLDVNDKSALKLLLKSLNNEEATPNLDGIFHLAGALDDGVLEQQTSQRFDRVLAPKLVGATNLHELSIELNLCLSHFVLFSSTASLLGSAGQSNHAAGNAFMDGLAVMRKQMGLPGLSINWGAWGEIGAVVNQKVGARINSKGMGLMNPSDALAHMGFAMLHGAAQLGIFSVNWQQFENRYVFKLFEDFVKQDQSPQSAVTSESDIKRRLMLVADANKERLLNDYVAECIARILGQEDAASINIKSGFFELGMDSLTAMELKNRLQRDLNCSLPSTLTFDFPSPQELATHLAKTFSQPDDNSQQILKGEVQDGHEGRHKVGKGNVSHQPGASKTVDDVIDEELLEGLSDDEFDSLIDNDLDKLDEAESNYE